MYIYVYIYTHIDIPYTNTVRKRDSPSASSAIKRKGVLRGLAERGEKRGQGIQGKSWMELENWLVVWKIVDDSG